MFQSLKWTEDGELSAVDMARILDALGNHKPVEYKVKEEEPTEVSNPLRSQP